jgi:hypothetical protein
MGVVGATGRVRSEQGGETENTYGMYRRRMQHGGSDH